ncbi:uncharacterized protein J3R85_005337 [Psidium guajava]|nr:uncharacterized protein J3R85_005337 [Psidium guajava]
MLQKGGKMPRQKQKNRNKGDQTRFLGLVSCSLNSGQH